MKKSMSKDIQRAFFPYFGNKKDDILKAFKALKPWRIAVPHSLY